MPPELIQRYQPGGDIFVKLSAQFGGATARVIAQAAMTGDEHQVNAAIDHAKYGADKPTSVVGILAGQSPSDWVNNSGDYWSSQINSVGFGVFLNLLKKPFFLLGVVLFGLLVWAVVTGKFKPKIPVII